MRLPKKMLCEPHEITMSVFHSPSVQNSVLSLGRIATWLQEADYERLACNFFMAAACIDGDAAYVTKDKLTTLNILCLGTQNKGWEAWS